jgi:prepilin-type processing-associated H-X9-DG protein
MEQAVHGSGDTVLGVREVRWPNALYPQHCPAGPYSFRPDRLTEQSDLCHFRSLHSGGANLLLADGAVRFFSYSADAAFPALATRSGGEPVEVP